MRIINKLPDLSQVLNIHKRSGKTLGFVPTMGCLHQGHLALIDIAKSKCDIVIVSVYVNPTQFGVNEDFASYPNTEQEDAEKLEKKGVDVLFMPTQQQIYPSGLQQQTIVSVPHLIKKYCGEYRPQHFDGVTGVLSRLFNCIQPNVVVFGKKDYQQLAVVRQMLQDLLYPIDIIGVDTVRESSGLAKSSRNMYLTDSEQRVAPLLYSQLEQAKQNILHSELSFIEIETQSVQTLERSGFQVQYFCVVRQTDLREATRKDTAIVILCAAYLGKTRLIDNIEVNVG